MSKDAWRGLSIILFLIGQGFLWASFFGADLWQASTGTLCFAWVTMHVAAGPLFSETS